MKNKSNFAIILLAQIYSILFFTILAFRFFILRLSFFAGLGIRLDYNKKLRF